MTLEPVHATLGPSLCIVAQGAKVMMLGNVAVGEAGGIAPPA